MDPLRSTHEQLLSLYRSMSPGRRAVLIALPLLIAGALGLLLSGERPPSHVPLSWGKLFNPEELSNAEQALRDAGCTDFRRDGQRLLVPADQADRCNAALLQGGLLPEDWAAEWEKQLEKSNIFSLRQDKEEAREIARAKLVGRMIRAVPEIEYADVIWARGSNGSRWSRSQKVTATVNVRPRKGSKLSPQLVRSLRASVAAMVPDLTAADVTVFDQIAGRSYSGDAETESLNVSLLSRIHDFEQSYRDRILESLSYIPNVLVTVTADVNRLSPTVTEQEVIAALPSAVRVNVSIPEDYYQAVAGRRGLIEGRTVEHRRHFEKAVAGIRTEVETNVKKSVAGLLPLDSAGSSLHVGSFVPIDMPAADEAPEQSSQAAAPFAAGLALLVLSALWMIAHRTARSRAAVRPNSRNDETPAGIDGAPADENGAGTETSATNRQFNEPPHQPHDSHSRIAENARVFADHPRQATRIAEDAPPPEDPTAAAPVPFGFLAGSGASGLLACIADEHPQTIALIISHLTPALAAEVIAGLAPGKQAEVVRRIAGIQQASPDVIRDIEKSLAGRMRTAVDHAPPRRGASLVAEILNVTNRNARAQSRDRSNRHPSDPSDNTQPPTVLFDDLLQLDDRKMHLLLHNIDYREWAVALKGASAAVRKRIFGLLPDRPAALLKRQIETLGPVRIGDIEARQRQIIETVRRLQHYDKQAVAA